MSKTVAGLCALLLGIDLVAASPRQRLRPVTWSVAMLGDLRSGDSGIVGVAALRARMQSGWHVYSLSQPAGGPRPTAITIVSDPPFRLAGAIGRPAPDTIPDRTSTGLSEIYSDSVMFRLPIGVRALLPRGERPLVVAVIYQACSARLCLAPRTDTLEVSTVAR